MQALANAMQETIKESIPVERYFHASYMGSYDSTIFDDDVAMVYAARCARVSYLNHDRSKPEWDKDLELARSLEMSRHASPFEHAAVASIGQHANCCG